MGKGVEIRNRRAEAGFSTAEEDGRLRILLIGGLQVARGGEALELPRSKKCRALIAYLAANPRPQRREHLCETLWDVPDDPKGALRWSLSKLRRVLGDALVADRAAVSIDRSAAAVDLDALESIEGADTEALEALAAACGGTFGEDLDLPRCPDFQAWLIAMREDVRQAQLKVLGELVRRLRGEPERALPYARARVALDPLGEAAREELLAILAEAGRGEEAERQRQLAVAVLEEARIAVPPALARARKPEPSRAPRIQRIQFCTAPDGTSIAYSAVGSGPPLVKTANWMGHLEHEWESPLLRHWLVELSREHSLVRYDARGNGLSDRRAADLSLDAFVQDLEAVTATLGEEPFDLLGISQGAAVAIAFAARHPERVRRLVLFGGFPRGWCHSRSKDVQAQWEAMITLAGLGWGTNNPAFRQMFTTLFAPRATSEQADWFNELQRVSASPQEAQRLLRAIGWFDVSGELSAVRTPTLVFHCRHDAMVPFDSGRQIAGAIPGAQFVGLDSDNHLPLEDEPAWAVLVEQLRAFLAR